MCSSKNFAKILRARILQNADERLLLQYLLKIKMADFQCWWNDTMWSSNLFSASSCFPRFSCVRFFWRIFRVSVLQPVSRVFRDQVQAGFRSSRYFFHFTHLLFFSLQKTIFSKSWIWWNRVFFRGAEKIFFTIWKSNFYYLKVYAVLLFKNYMIFTV